MLSLTAAGMYLGVGAACLYAATFTGGEGPSRPARAIWLAIGGLFVILAASRIFSAEDRVRDLMRAWLNAGVGYQARRTIQGPIAAAVLAASGVAGIALLLGFRWVRAGARAERALIWATRASAAMMVLVALRLISFHPVDAILYQPLRLNWVFDIGLTAVVGIAALTYAHPRRGGSWTARASGQRSPRD